VAQVVLLDSDILSEILKGIDVRVRDNTSRYLATARVLSFSSATALEILYGYERIGAHAKIKRAEELFAANDEIVPSVADYRLAASIAGTMSKRGTFIGLVDPLIASTAIRCGYAIATGNTEHFDFIRKAGYDFPLENWRA
jgi:predicted nucleic acid-binding protein